MTTETLLEGTVILGPAHIAMAVCVAMVIISALWVFVTFSDLCCCLQRHPVGDLENRGDDQKAGTTEDEITASHQREVSRDPTRSHHTQTKPGAPQYKTTTSNKQCKKSATSSSDEDMRSHDSSLETASHTITPSGSRLRASEDNTGGGKPKKKKVPTATLR